jgi:hypothetical protein
LEYSGGVAAVGQSGPGLAEAQLANTAQDPVVAVAYQLKR